MIRALFALQLIAVLLIVVALAAGGVIFKGGSPSEEEALDAVASGAAATRSSSGVSVIAVALSPDLSSNGRAINPGTAFPAGTSQVNAVVLLGGAKPGVRITGTWFQLGTSGAGQEGQQIVSGDVVLSDVTNNGRSRVTFALKRESSGLPTDAWLFRLYANGELLKTAAFVISDAVPARPPRNPRASAGLPLATEAALAR